MNLCINSAQAIGCSVNHISSNLVATDDYHLESFIWELLKLYFLSKITTECHPILETMLEQFRIIDPQDISPEVILLHWVNFILEKSNLTKQKLRSLDDFKGSQLFLYVLSYLYSFLNKPEESNECLDVLKNNNDDSAEFVIKKYRNLLTMNFLYPSLILSPSNSRLILLCFSALFDKYDGLYQLQQPNVSNPEIEPKAVEKKNSSNNLVLQKLSMNFVNNDLEKINEETEQGTREERGLSRVLFIIFERTSSSTSNYNTY